MLRTSLGALFLLFYAAGFSQTPPFEWVQTWGSNAFDQVRNCEIDVQGNVICVGSSRAFSATYSTGVIRKFDPAGNLMWMASFGNGNQAVFLYKVDTDASGNIYLIGRAESDSLDADPHPQNTFILSSQGYNGFLFHIKLNDQGQFMWAVAQPGMVWGYGLAVAKSGEVYSTGVYEDFDANPNPGLVDSVTQSNGKRGVLVQKLDAAGQQKWIRLISGNDNMKAKEVALSKDQSLVVGGSYLGSVDFDPGVNTAMEHNTKGLYEAYILRFDTAGNFERVITLEGTGESDVYDVEMDAQDMIYVTGSYKQDVDFDPGPGLLRPVNPFYTGWYIAKYDTSGMLHWAKPFHNDVQHPQRGFWVTNLDVDTVSSNVYLAGGFMPTQIRFDPQKVGGITLGSSGQSDIFLAEYDTAGSVQWAEKFGSSQHDLGVSVCKSPSGALYLAGEFSQTVDFDPGPGNTQSTSNAGSIDGFLLKFDRCVQPPANVVQNELACYSYTSLSGVKVFNDTTLSDTIKSLSGCDSVIQQTNVTIRELGAAVSRINGGLKWTHANDPSYSSYNAYWYDCDRDSILTFNAFDPLYPPVNGNYAVIVHDLNDYCFDTSGCVSITDIGLEEKLWGSSVSIYPNPTDNQVWVTGQQDSITSLTLMDLTGREIKRVERQDFMDVSSVRAGTYFLRISSGSFTAIRKLIIQ